MKQDVRARFKNESIQKRMPKGHQDRFLNKLEKALPEEKGNVKKLSISYWGVAASIAILCVLGGGMFWMQDKQIIDAPQVVSGDDHHQSTNETADGKTISLGDLSPDLKKVEEYYTTNINLQLAMLELNDENKEVFEGYMAQLATLASEYKTLNTELTAHGPSEETVTALINNLQLRLQLLYRLQEKLKELKQSNQNETIQSI